MKSPGLFITLEGIDGSGKSTHQRLLVDHLRALGYRVCATREPGGTAMGEQIRRLFFLPSRGQRSRRSSKRHPLTELALLYAARAQHLDEVIRPALARGEVVISDRFNDASRAYQGYGRKLGIRTVESLDRIICGRTQPDLTILLDVDPRTAFTRVRGRAARRNSRIGIFEAQGLNFQSLVRAGYLAIARRDPRRVKVVHASGPAAQVQAKIRRLVERLLPRHEGR